VIIKNFSGELLQSIVMIVKSRRMRCVEPAGGRDGKKYEILVGKPEELFRSPRLRWDYCIKMTFRRMVTGCGLAQGKDQWQAVVNM
jgi:hypothetical protein